MAEGPRRDQASHEPEVSIVPQLPAETRCISDPVGGAQTGEPRDLVAGHHPDRGRAENAHSPVLSAVQEHLEKPGVVPHGGEDPAPGVAQAMEVVAVPVADRHRQLGRQDAVGDSAPVLVGPAQEGVWHSQGPEEFLFQEIRGGHAAGAADRFAQEGEAGVAVLDTGARREVERSPLEHLPDEPVQGLTGGPEFLVAGDGTETGGVGHEVDETNSVLFFRHFRNDLVKRLVQFQETSFDQQAGGAGDDGLGAGGDEEDGAGAHRRGVEGAHSAEGPGSDDPVSPSHQDGGSVFGPGGQHALDQGVGAVEAGGVEAEVLGAGVGGRRRGGPETAGSSALKDRCGAHVGEEEASGGGWWGHDGAEKKSKE